MFKRYFLGPLVVMAMIGVVEYFHTILLFEPSAALPFAGMAISLYFGGWRSNMASALLASSYALVLHPDDPARVAQAVIACFAVAIGGSFLRESERKAWTHAGSNQDKAEFVDSINGNLKLLERAHKMSDDLLEGWEVLSQSARYEKIAQIRGTLANLRLLAEGWHKMAKERGFIIREDDLKASVWPFISNLLR
jgi:hypothetical protein